MLTLLRFHPGTYGPKWGLLSDWPAIYQQLNSFQENQAPLPTSHWVKHLYQRKQFRIRVGPNDQDCFLFQWGKHNGQKLLFNLINQQNTITQSILTINTAKC